MLCKLGLDFRELLALIVGYKICIQFLSLICYSCFFLDTGVRCNYILIGFFNALIYLKPAPMYPTPYSDEDEYML